MFCHDRHIWCDQIDKFLNVTVWCRVVGADAAVILCQSVHTVASAAVVLFHAVQGSVCCFQIIQCLCNIRIIQSAPVRSIADPESIPVVVAGIAFQDQTGGTQKEQAGDHHTACFLSVFFISGKQDGCHGKGKQKQPDGISFQKYFGCFTQCQKMGSQNENCRKYQSGFAADPFQPELVERKGTHQCHKRHEQKRVSGKRIGKRIKNRSTCPGKQRDQGKQDE